MERDDDPFAVPLSRVMTRTPRTAAVEELGSAVVYRMEQFGIMAMPVTDDQGIVVGVVHLHDLMRAGLA
jgi:arabinose-5-phosphate isomerase